MDDMYKSIKVFLYDRTSSPLFGAFFLSWLLVNFKIVLTIFSGEDLQIKFQTIDALFSVTVFGQQHFGLGFFIHSFLLPAILTFLYIYLYPLLAKPVYEHSLRKQKELREIKQESENNRLLTLEESRKVLNSLSDLQVESREEITRLNNQISSLLETNKELESVGKNIPDGFKVDAENPEVGLSLHALNLHERINLLAKEEFVLADLFNVQEWSSFSNSKKRNLGKKFKEAVEEGKYKGVKFNAFSSSNQALYVKLTKQKSLSELQVKILNTFVDNDHNGSQLQEDKLLNLVGGHHIEFGLAIEDLVDKKYLRPSGFPVGSYELEKKGRQYIIDNGFLKK